MATKTNKSTSIEFSPKSQKRIIILMWVCGLFPFLIIYIMLLAAKPSLPSTETLENPPELQASIVYADNGEELGRYWRINRKSVSYKQISQNVYSALIATEDERYYEHSGVDARGLARAVFGALIGQSKGGASTISQQLAKLLFTDVASSSWKRLQQKFGENILATRLERNYTKEEIIAMYLNRFDFLYNAVGISSAAHVYFNKKPSELNMQEAATLIGMCKNPSLYNPRRDYKMSMERRNVVLSQWYKNSNSEGVTVKLTEEMFDSLKALPIVLDYQIADHKVGPAPYFREVLRRDVTNLLEEKDEAGNLKYHKKDGSAFNIYEDGLRIYTTINTRLQNYAEQAVVKHLSETLQPEFDKNNKRTKYFPFSNHVNKEQIENIMNSAIRRSDRYITGIRNGLTKAQVLKQFDKKQQMVVFSWKGDIDTVMTPRDSIRYYKGFLHTGLLSIEPQTGFIKAWVGGIDFSHFAYDHVKLGKRQVGSTIKPFVYSAAIRFGVVTPCTKFPDIPYCIDVPISPTQMKSWCPNPGGKTNGELISVKKALALSMNNITVKVMDQMGATQGPQAVAQLMRDLGIEIRQEDIVPAMCLGIMDLSLYEMVGAQAAIANKGIYNKPLCILRIEDRNGDIIYEGIPESKESMNAQLAYTTLNLMKGVVNGGTGGSLRGGRPWGGIPYPMAGKTGTTQNNTDGWYMGLTPDLVTGIWVGAEDRSVSFRSMEWGQGARMALPIFGYYMQKVYKDSNIKISKGDFEAPDNYDSNIFNCDEDDNQNTNIDIGGF
jgi:penicillin-binding protein 1A